MVAIRNLYWTERIAAFIVGGLIWLARCVRSSARRRGGVRAARPKSVLLTGFLQNGCRVAESGSHRRHILGLGGFVDRVVCVGDLSNRGSAALAISGMALLLYGVAGLCRTQVIARNIASESDRE